MMRKTIFKNFFRVSLLLIIFSLWNPHFLLAYEKEINRLSVILAERIAKSGINRIAVVDLTDLQGNVTELGRFLAEEFSVSLAEMEKGFEVVDRTHLQVILKEHKLSATGLIDPQTARKLGQIVGVQALVTGTLTPFGESVRLSVKVLNTKTASVIGASRGNIAATEAIKILIKSGIETERVTTTGTNSTIHHPKIKKASIAGGKNSLSFTKYREGDIPDEIVIKSDAFKEYKKGPVKLTHKKHNVDYKIVCAECHHVYKEGKNVYKDGDPVQKCSECHDALKSEGKVKKLTLAYHKNCQGCHKELETAGKKAGPTKKCDGCHEKKK